MATRKRSVEKRPRPKAAARRAPRRVPRKRKRSKLEDRFAALVEYHGWPTPERELRFHEAGVVYAKRRQFRFDFAFTDYKIAITASAT